jgi:Trk K+ transport system NAD-binding subunit
MPGRRLDRLQIDLGDQHGRFVGSRWWREWCFARTALAHFRLRLLLMVLIVASGALVFRAYHFPEPLSTWEAMYYSWSLVFGEPPEQFPASWAIRPLFFLMPIFGLTIIIEGIVDFSLMLRDRRRYERSWCKTMATSMTDHVVLVGLGRLGFRIFKLLRKLGEAVVVFERDPNNQFLEDVRRDGSPLFIGDARREALLEEANIRKAKSIILATDDDLANLEIALDARHIVPNLPVVLRMFDQNIADKVGDAFDIHLAMSQSAISAPSFTMAAVDRSIEYSFAIDDQLVVMQRWKVCKGGPMCGRKVGEVMTEFSIGVVRRKSKEGSRLFPGPETMLAEGDELLVEGEFTSLMKLATRMDRTRFGVDTAPAQ